MAADEPVVEVWPENWQVVLVFQALRTQWRVGPGGATGLDYVAIEPVLRLMAVKRAAWPDVFADLRVLENEALKTMHPEVNPADAGATQSRG